MASPLKSVCEDLIRVLDHKVANLESIARKLETDTEERFSKTGVNPASLLRRIKKLERELPTLSDQCQTLIRSKQELVDAAKQQLVSNRQLLLQLSARSGLQVQQEDSAFSSFTQAVSEWDNQAAAHAAGDQRDYLSGADLNKALAKSIIN